MTKRNQHIPVNTLPAGTREGIMIGRTTINGLPRTNGVERPHRDNGHLFILQEKGKTHIEIDFQKHILPASSIIYIHPSQIHRLIAFKNATVSSWIITSENIHPGNLKLLENLAPVNALVLKSETRAVIARTAALCIELSKREQEKLYNSILKESCNTLVALFVSQYLAEAKTTDNYTRAEGICKAFKKLLENNFTTVKSPKDYASRLNISTPYLNECVNAATGRSVSHHIQQRVVLEARRLLYHSDKSVKEIAGELGYDDFSYFTRLFVRVTGMSPVAFRTKILE